MNYKFALGLILALNCLAQGTSPGRAYNTDGITPPSISPGTPAGSYALSGFDNVNLFNRKGSISIPITEVRTRGGAGYTMKLNLDQAWRVRIYADCSNGGSCVYFHTPLPDWWAGQEIDYGPGMVAGRFMDKMIGCAGGSTSQDILTRLSFIDSNGTEQTLVDSSTKGRGVRVTELSSGTCTSLITPTNPQPLRGPRFESTDGQAMTFVASAGIVESPRVNPGQSDSRPTLYPSGTLYMADGSRYTVVDGKVTKIQDRNGNTVTIVEQGTSGLDITEANRTIQVRSLTPCDVLNSEGDPGDRCDKISLGINTGDPVVRIYWRSLSATGVSPRTNKDLFANNLNIDPASPAQTFNPMVATKMVLPNGQAYRFLYDDFGEVIRATLPTGGYFTYSRSTLGWGTEAPGLLRQVNSRTEFDEQNNFRRLTEYAVDGSGANLSTVVKDYSNASRTNFDPGSKRLVKLSRTTFPTSFVTGPPGASFYGDWRDGKESKTDILDLSLTATFLADSIPPDKILKRSQRVWELREATPPSTTIGTWQYGPGASFNPRETSRTESIHGLTKTNTITMAYDSFNNLTSETTGGYGGGVLQVKSTTFETAANYVNEPAHLRRLVKEESVGATATPESTTQYEYDIYTNPGGASHDLTLAGAVGATMYEDRQLTERGNVARVKQWLNTGNRWLTSDKRYNVLGNLVQSWQPKDAAESFERSQQFIYTSTCNFGYPTTVKDALNRSSTFQYNCRTGQVTSFTDVNSKVTGMSYVDPLDRLTTVTSPDGLGSTGYAYNDAPGALQLTVTKSQNSCGVNNIVSNSFFDAFGRLSLERRTDDLGAIDRKLDYDGLGRTYWQGDPYRGASEVNGTTTDFDGLGRALIVTHTADGSATRLGYREDETLTRDSQGKWRKTQNDALGRIVSVVEDPTVTTANTSIPGLVNETGTLNFSTSYGYDGRGNLTSVTQGSQTRGFDYDSLGRLLAARNPEMGTGAFGTVSYDYFDYGGLKQKTEPGSVVTTLTYDELARLKTKSYSGAAVTTNPVTFCYDGSTLGSCAGAPTGTNLLGRPTMVVSGDYRTKMVTYDGLGRVTKSAQKFGAEADLEFEYLYTQAGGIAETKYPSGKRVAQCFDGSGQVKEVKNGASQAPWVSAVQYEVNGGQKQATLGNGVIETREYNSRWQPAAVKAMQGSTSLLELQYRYCPLESAACSTNNGNVISQRVIHSGLNAITSYEYDAISRISRAVGTNSFEQVFEYDRWGNRALASGYRPFSGMTVSSLGAYNAAKNQLNELPELPPLSAYTAFKYDLRGNQLTQVGGRAYQFDAENRMVEAKRETTVEGQYGYDGDGRRVESIAGGKTTRFVYDAFGELSAEYEVGASVSPLSTTYIIGDALGSTRLAMRPDGSLRRYEYAPFGEEIANGDFGRGTEYSEVSGKVRVAQRFTSKERDAESGLDYFGARYMSGAQGRFTSPDPHNPIMIAQMAASAGLPVEATRSQLEEFLEDPQNWNKFSYVRNNPLRLTDPFGEAPVEGHHLIPERKALTGLAAEFTNAVKAGADGVGYPNQPGFNGPHRAYNKAVEQVLQGFEKQFGGLSRNRWSLSQWKQAANAVLNSNNKAIRDFLDLLNKNNAGKTLPALAAAINAYKPSASLVASSFGESLLNLFRAMLFVMVDPALTDSQRHVKEEIKNSHSNCLLDRNTGLCVY